MPCHKRATGRYTAKALHRLERSRTLEPSAHAVLVVPRQLEIANGFRCGEIPAGRMNATIKLMLVQLTMTIFRIIPTDQGAPNAAEMFV